MAWGLSLELWFIERSPWLEISSALSCLPSLMRERLPAPTVPLDCKLLESFSSRNPPCFVLAHRRCSTPSPPLTCTLQRPLLGQVTGGITGRAAAGGGSRAGPVQNKEVLQWVVFSHLGSEAAVSGLGKSVRAWRAS